MKYLLITLPGNLDDAEVEEIRKMIPDILLSLCNVDAEAEVTIVDEDDEE